MQDEHRQEKDEAGDPVETRGKEGASGRETWIIAGAILLGSLIVSGGILFSRGTFQKTSDSGATGILQPSENPSPIAERPERRPGESVKVSTDDDAVLGDKDAPITLIEFSDYECPFCKRSFTDVLPELKKTYIDTGKVKLVFRDFPLSFHANAGKEAEAAECARSLGDDVTYYKFHDQIFTKTTSNGTGLALTELPAIAKNLGLNVNQFQQCLDSGKFKDEVAKDMADGEAAGISGTPSWIIGASSKDGQIEGQLVVGAQPFSAFKAIIDEKLGNK